MKKMNYFAAFAIMMAMGMNANANNVGAEHNEFHMDGKGRVEVRVNVHHKMDKHHDHKMSKHEHQMMEERRRMEEHRRREEARRREEMRHHAAHHHHAAHSGEVVIVDNDVAAGMVGVAAGVAVAAFISALMK